MLELGQIIQEIDALTDESRVRAERQAGQLAQALAQASLDGAAWQAHRRRIAEARTQWLCANPLDDHPVTTTFPPEEAPTVYTALATDGSQIPLDRHELTPCFVINVGQIALHYGGGERPTLASRATLYYRDEDILLAGDGGELSYVTERQIGTKRLLEEAGALAGLISEHAGRERSIALIDGTLILWAQEAEADERKIQVIGEFCQMLASAQAANVPIAGYLSSPNSREVVNALRVTLCPDEHVVCKACAHDKVKLPCAPINRVTDAALFAKLLSPGERSPLFESRSQVLIHYPPAQKIAFFYLHAGPEIARVEVPLWVAQSPDLVARVHSLVLDQARKGNGYPVCLMEAHERAVVRGPEREAFFRLVERAFVNNGVGARRSRKAFAKRTRLL